MEGFDEETKDVIQQIHLAWKSKAVLPDYAILRDRILSHHERLDVQISALSAVVRLTYARRAEHDEVDGFDDVDGEEQQLWNEFLALAELSNSRHDAARAVAADATSDSPSPETPSSSASTPRQRARNYNESNRRRNLATIAALWSLEILEHYGWSRAGHGQVRVIRNAAVQYPDFELDLVPRLNCTLLSRHCSAIRDEGQARPLNEVRIQPFRDLALDALSATTPDPNRDQEWMTDCHGMARVIRDVRLHELRPRHYEIYLLRKDRYGVWEPAGARHDTPGNSALPSSTPMCDQQGWTTPMLFDAMIQHTPGSPQLSPAYDFSADMQMSPMPVLGHGLSGGASVTNAQTPAGAPSMPSDLSMPDANATLALSPDSAIDELPHCWSHQNVYPLGGGAPPSSYVLRDASVDYMMQTRESTVSSTMPSRESTVFSPLLQAKISHQSSQATSEWDSCCSSRSVSRQPSTHTVRNARKRPRASACTRKHQPVSSRTSRESSYEFVQRPDDEVPESITSSPTSSAGTSSPLLVSSDSVESSDPTLEDVIHNEHRLAILSYVDDHGRSQSFTSKQWLTPQTAWATVYSASPSLRNGRATCEEQADVVYFTAADYVSYANTGAVIHKPCVIKEEFQDQGMHNTAQVLSLLSDSCAGSRQDSVACYSNESDHSEPICARRDSLARLTQSPAEMVDTRTSLSLRSIARAHRPIFTMLPRFRLLETLEERQYWTAVRSSSSLPPQVSSSSSFNSVGQPGEFSGICMNASCGTYVRNLEGIKYCVIVSEAAMETEWDRLIKQSDDWVPRGRELLIVLKEGDVLLLPPGLRMLYTMHSPTSYLVEGGLFWDRMDILASIRSASWYYQRGFPTTATLGLQLPQILDNLREIVRNQTDDFRGSQGRAEFLETFEGAINTLQKSACTLSSS